MTHSHTTLKGLMTLTLLDADGNPMSIHRHHNNVTDGGKNMLLEMLRGNIKAKDIVPIMGNKEFNINADDPEKDRGAVRLLRSQSMKSEIEKNVLKLSFKGDAARRDQVTGGGLVIVSEDGKKRLYNFAPTKEPIEVVQNMPVLLNFDISVGN